MTTRNRALDAAHATLLELGVERTTMIEVSRRSGVGRTTLYRHWPDITALFADLLTRELTAAVSRADPTLTGLADLAGLAGPAGSAVAAGSADAAGTADAARSAEPAAARDADDLAEQLCAIADQIRTDPLLDALRRHESGILAEYILRRLGTSQRMLIGTLSHVLAQTIAADPRLAGRDPDAAATMLYLAIQGAVLSAPLADPPLDPATWRAELHRLIRGYLLP